jgi:large subunit ribosomal protein L10
MPRPEKVASVETIQKLFQDSDSFFITDYQGLNVADMTTLRKNLRENRVRYLVAKNTMFRLAARNVEQEQLDDHLNGPTAIAFTSEDPAVAARILYDSYKEKELPKIKAFVVDEQLFGGDEIKRLADLPSRDVLLSILVSAVESPLTSLVGSLDGVFRELVATVDALAREMESKA